VKAAALLSLLVGDEAIEIEIVQRREGRRPPCSFTVDCRCHKSKGGTRFACTIELLKANIPITEIIRRYLDRRGLFCHHVPFSAANVQPSLGDGTL
jgi:hypothetical protein